jgi:ribonuclease BN (tRNA processing enzyme)
MGVFRLLPLGVGDAFSARHYSSSFVLEAEGERLLVDCPHPIRKLLREGSASAGLSLDIPELRAVILTHLHSDHASGLEGLGFYCRFVLEKRMPLIAAPEVFAALWPRHLAGSMEWSLQEVGEPPVRRTLDEFFEAFPLAAEQSLTVGPFTIQFRPTIHNIPTVAMRIEVAGRTLGYSCDTAFDPTLIAWLASADLIVHEASGGFMHTPYECLAALPKRLRKKMRLIHYPDSFDPATSTIEVLRQGQWCVI